MMTSANHKVMMKRERDHIRELEIAQYQTEMEVERHFVKDKILKKHSAIDQ